MISAKNAERPANEPERLNAVRRYSVLDTPPDGAFDRITTLAARMFDVPIALVTIVDEDRIWFKSRHGLDAVAEIPRDPGLCASAILQEVPYVVTEARADPRTLANPLVAGEFGLQFYGAAPLRTRDGFNLGTLCVIDRKPREFSKADEESLQTLAGIVTDELELRMSSMRTIAAERQSLRDLAELASHHAESYDREHRVAEHLQAAMLPRAFPQLENVHFTAKYSAATNESLIGGDWYDAFVLRDGRVVLSIGDVSGHGLEAAVCMGKLRQSLRALSLQETAPHELLACLAQVLKDDGSDSLATSFIGILDPRTGVLDYASAAHPPPFVRTAAGEVSMLECGGVPLGMYGGPEWERHRTTLEPGSLLVLYTDGLTEATRNVMIGERLVAEALASAAVARSAHPAEALERAVLSNGSTDDVAILAVQFEAQAPGEAPVTA